MAGNFKITVLMENTAGNDKLIAEKALSFHIETNRTQGLFDTGETSAVVSNAVALGVDLSKIEWIALSHGHLDHTGGLAGVLEASGGSKVYAHPDVFVTKESADADGKMENDGVPLDQQAFKALGARLELSSKQVEITENIILTGEIPRKTDYEAPEEKYYLRNDEGVKLDPFLDDQSLILKTPKGLVILLGCAHAGVVNIVKHIIAITNESKIHAVVGGMHLMRSSEERIAKTVAALQELGVEKVGPIHCTGERAFAAFRAVYGDNCFAAPSGTVLEF
ncbi:MAG: MBL fold metallo-hydrolase [Planctomycetes bacterium]|nr:MBL fold metallo-hydrolase [Planctomycetota bacterium]